MALKTALAQQSQATSGVSRQTPYQETRERRERALLEKKREKAVEEFNKEKAKLDKYSNFTVEDVADLSDKEKKDYFSYLEPEQKTKIQDQLKEYRDYERQLEKRKEEIEEVEDEIEDTEDDIDDYKDDIERYERKLEMAKYKPVSASKQQQYKDLIKQRESRLRRKEESLSRDQRELAELTGELPEDFDPEAFKRSELKRQAYESARDLGGKVEFVYKDGKLEDINVKGDDTTRSFDIAYDEDKKIVEVTLREGNISEYNKKISDINKKLKDVEGVEKLKTARSLKDIGTVSKENKQRLENIKKDLEIRRQEDLIGGFTPAPDQYTFFDVDTKATERKVLTGELPTSALEKKKVTSFLDDINQRTEDFESFRKSQLESTKIIPTKKEPLPVITPKLASQQASKDIVSKSLGIDESKGFKGAISKFALGAGLAATRTSEFFSDIGPTPIGGISAYNKAVLDKLGLDKKVTSRLDFSPEGARRTYIKDVGMGEELKRSEELVKGQAFKPGQLTALQQAGTGLERAKVQFFSDPALYSSQFLVENIALDVGLESIGRSAARALESRTFKILSSPARIGERKGEKVLVKAVDGDDFGKFFVSDIDDTKFSPITTSRMSKGQRPLITDKLRIGAPFRDDILSGESQRLISDKLRSGLPEQYNILRDDIRNYKFPRIKEEQIKYKPQEVVGTIITGRGRNTEAELIDTVELISRKKPIEDRTGVFFERQKELVSGRESDFLRITPEGINPKDIDIPRGLRGRLLGEKPSTDLPDELKEFYLGRADRARFYGVRAEIKPKKAKKEFRVQDFYKGPEMLETRQIKLEKRRPLALLGVRKDTDFINPIKSKWDFPDFSNRKVLNLETGDLEERLILKEKFRTDTKISEAVPRLKKPKEKKTTFDVIEGDSAEFSDFDADSTDFSNFDADSVTTESGLKMKSMRKQKFKQDLKLDMEQELKQGLQQELKQDIGLKQEPKLEFETPKTKKKAKKQFVPDYEGLVRRVQQSQRQRLSFIRPRGVAVKPVSSIRNEQLQGNEQLQKTANRVRTSQKQEMLLQPMQKTKQFTSPKLDTKLDTRLKYDTGLILRLDTTTVPRLDLDNLKMQRTKLDTLNLFNFKIPRFDYTYTPRTPKRTPKRPRLPRKPESKDEKKLTKEETKPYNVFVKEKGKFVKVNKKTRNIYSAQNFGAEVTDSSTARTFRVKPAKQKKTDIIQKNKPRLRKFRSFSKTKNKKLKNEFIEKERYAIDTVSELQGITAKGWLKRKQNDRNKIGKLNLKL